MDRSLKHVAGKNIYRMDGTSTWINSGDISLWIVRGESSLTVSTFRGNDVIDTARFEMKKDETNV